MRKLNQLWAISGVALALAFSGTNGLAQGGGPGGFGGGGAILASPAQLQRRTENMRQTLGVTNDSEWTIIQPRLVRVEQLQAEIRITAMASMGGGGALRALAALGVTPDPSSDALTKALDDGAPIAEIKLDMARVRQARKAKQADLARAQADLQSVVTIRQEAILLSNGLLD
jgi:hypothetical protein